MRILSYLAMLAVSAILSLLLPDQALAQSWKPLCVNGGNTAGAHNNTWQKINTPSVGGSTWKQAGGCIAPPPPTCSNGATNYPTCTLPTCSNGATNYPTCTPLARIDLSGIPTSLVSTGSYSPQHFVQAYLSMGKDGRWTALDDSGTYTGAYLINALPQDYEIYIGNYLQTGGNGTYGYDPSGYQNIYIDTWINAATGTYGNPAAIYIDNHTGSGENPNYGAKVTFTLTVRKIADHSVSASINVTMTAVTPDASFGP